MATKLLTIILISLAISLVNANIQTVNGKIKITIGTTSACGDTVTFVADLVPVYEEFKEFLEIEFVPWGRTRIENGSLICQFGDNDCWANRLHRCALNMLTNQDAKMHYMACEFTRPLPGFTQGTYLCAQAVGLNLIDLDYCMSTTGDALEGPAEQASVTPMQVINFVPSIVFNDVVSVDNHNQARSRLRTIVCMALADDPTTGITSCQI